MSTAPYTYNYILQRGNNCDLDNNCLIELNSRIGNHDGQLAYGGVNFSLTSKDIRGMIMMGKTVVWCTSRKINGQWQNTSLAL